MKANLEAVVETSILKLYRWPGAWGLPTQWQMKPWHGSLPWAAVPETATLEIMSGVPGIFRVSKPYVYVLVIFFFFPVEIFYFDVQLFIKPHKGSAVAHPKCG